MLVFEAVLLVLCLVLAVLVLWKQLGISPFLQPKLSAGSVKGAGRSSGGVSNATFSSIRRRFSASWRSSAMAHSLSVNRSQVSTSMNGSQLRSRGEEKNHLSSPCSSARRGAESEDRFVEVLKAVTYLDDTVEHSAYGFSVSTKKKPGVNDYPWIEYTLPHGPAHTLLKRHELITRLNSDSTGGWSAERVKKQVLASPIRLSVEVRKEGSVETRHEVLYRGRIGRVFVLCKRYQDKEPCGTSRALAHFVTLLEQSDSLEDLRESIAERMQDVTCPAKEREVFTKILAHALSNSESVTDEVLRTPTSMQGRTLGASALDAGDGIEDDLVERYNLLWTTAAAEAAKARGREEKIAELRAERERLHADNKSKDAALRSAREHGKGKVDAEVMLLEVTSRVAQLEEELERAKGDARDAKEAFARREERAGARDARHTMELAARAREVEDLKAKLETESANAKRCKRTIDELQQALRESERAKHAVGAAKVELLEAQIVELKGEVEQHKALVVHEQAQKQELTGRVDGLETKLKDAEEDRGAAMTSQVECGLSEGGVV
jgi:hypothetical protein